MSWLIESYFEEAENNVYRFRPSTDKNRGNLKTGTSDNIDARDPRDKIKKDANFAGDHDIEKDQMAYKNAKIKAIDNIGNPSSREQISQAADAIARHDRRHPDRKVVNASADIIEILQ